MTSTKQSSLTDQLKAWALDHLDLIFSILRWLKPIVVLNNNAFVARFDHVQEVLSRDEVFHVPYETKMRKVTAGENFFLGMQNTPQYTRDVSNMRLAVRRDDVESRIAPFVDVCAEKIVSAAKGRIDVPQELSLVVATRLVGDYFGTPGWNEVEYADANSSLFEYLFHSDDPEQEKVALVAAEKMRNYLDGAIAERKSNRGKRDDVLERCLTIQDSGLPGMTDLDIRNNLIGLIIGAIPTTSKCVVHMLDYLLSKPELLAKAQQAAREDNNSALTQFMLESLRFRPFAAGIVRICAEDYVLARGSIHSTKIPKGARVVALTQSAMMDGCKIKSPGEFRLDRPNHSYLHFGYALHACFGQYINRVQIPRIAKALLKRKGLRRASGSEGQVQAQGPFPVHLVVEFDA